jgi:hypothetical protein
LLREAVLAPFFRAGLLPVHCRLSLFFRPAGDPVFFFRSAADSAFFLRPAGDSGVFSRTPPPSKV